MAKSDKVKIPKKVAGLKVPKAIRKSGALETLVGSQMGRQILADALVAAAAAAAAALVQARSQASPNGRKGGTRSVLSAATTAAAGALGEIITDAAQNFIGGGNSSTAAKSPTGKKAKSKRAGAPALNAGIDRPKADPAGDGRE